MDCKATVHIGAFSRGGQTRGDHKASDHDLGCKEKYIPCGIVDEDTAQLYVTFGSSFKTSDFIVDTLAAWWQGLSAMEQGEINRVQIKMANGSESSGVRTQFLHRMVPFASHSRRRRMLLKINDLSHSAFVNVKPIESTTYAFYAIRNAASSELSC